MAYNSNKIDSSRLTEEPTRYIFEKRTIGFKEEEEILVDDMIEMSNHFTAFNYLMEVINMEFSNEQIKIFHCILKTSTADVQKWWFNVGESKSIN